MALSHIIHKNVSCFWQWLARKLKSGYRRARKPSEFEKGVLIEKYGFNRYL
ncbi:MAG: hypothetical protein MI892_16395 [Desulfobacterales bacterium]|nr:hypothetical protein [Desulfobacterales bacterium]